MPSMNEELLEFGDALEAEAANSQVDRLREITKEYLSSTISSSAPLACRVLGADVTVDGMATLVPQETQVLLYFENYGKVVRSSWMNFASFYLQREPWQDYDICAFPEVGAWCIALTHNERIVVAGMDAPVQLAPNNSLHARQPRRAAA